MKAAPIIGIGFVLCSILFVGHASASQTAATVAVAGFHIEEIRMFNVRDGWAEAYGPEGYRVLRTTDGAQTWKDVTPRPFPFDTWDCEFATMKTAWITIHTNGWAGLLMTTNGGSSWARVGTSFHYFTEASNVRFVDDHFGIAQVGDGGLGSLYYTFYQTSDGGVTWKQVDITSPNSLSDDPGAVHLSSYDGDHMAYYPQKTFIITYGESGDFAPRGYAGLSISTDFGKSWRELHLPLPAEQRNEYTTPILPVFFGAHDGILPVELFTQNANSNTFHELLFYRTTDGGKTWNVSQTVAIGKNGMASDDCDVISLKDMLVRNGGVLNVTHDGGKTWHTIKPNVNLGMENSSRDVDRMNFADAAHGWMIISDDTTFSPYGNFLFHRTTDGGKTWTELPLKISQ